MKVKNCPKCGKHNLVDAWTCVDCGETLSVNTIVETDSVNSESTKEQNSGAEFYERGKNHFERDEFEAAKTDFKEAIRLSPNNADYHAWLARSFLRTHDVIKAIDLANKALAIDSHCSVALIARGYGYFLQKEYSKALKDYDLASQYEPNDTRVYFNRALAYRALDDAENSIADIVRSFALSPKFIEKYESTDAKWQQKHSVWYETVFKHLKQTALPQLTDDEKFANYYPAWFSWQGEKSISTGYDSHGRGTINTVGHINYGTGYIYFTNLNTYVQLLGDLSSQYQHPSFSPPSSPTLATVGNIAGTLLDLALGGSGTGGAGKSHYDHREGGDVRWKIPFASVSSVKTFQNTINIVSLQINCQILPHFNDQDKLILTSIQMGVSGKLSQILSSMSTALPKQVEPAGASNQDVFQVLKQLAELKDKGVITETEFESKKKELLARL